MLRCFFLRLLCALAISAYRKLPEGVSAPQTLLISVDPARDTPEALATYVANKAFPAGLQGLQGMASGYFNASSLGSGAFNIEITNQGSVGVTNISETALRVFPNPTRGMIQLPQIDLERVEAYDATGRLVVSQQQPSTSIDLGAQPAGLYILKMYAGEEVYSAKVVKE